MGGTRANEEGQTDGPVLVYVRKAIDALKP